MLSKPDSHFDNQDDNCSLQEEEIHISPGKESVLKVPSLLSVP
jgi:hypothetical protein